jgi:hypothetical protein
VTLCAGISRLSPLTNLIKPRFGSKKQLLCKTDYDIQFLLATLIEVNRDAPFRFPFRDACGDGYTRRSGFLFGQACRPGQWPYRRARDQLGLRR